MDDDALDPPLRVDWVDARELADGAGGRLGLTFLPGKHGASERYPGLVYRRSLEADLDTLRDGGIHYLVLLVDDNELRRWGDPAIVRRAAERQITVDRRPVADGEAPPSLEHMDETLGRLTRARHGGDVAVACMGGVGRTGTVAACALVAAGWPADRAIDRIRALRHPTAVETEAQVAFVSAYERHVAAGAGARSGRQDP